MALLAAPHTAQPPASIAFEGITVLSMDAEAPRELQDHTVVVADGRIAALGPRSSTPVPDGTLRIPGAGRFLMPGLIDAHVHTSADELAMFLAAGVTTVREMNGSPAHLALSEEIAAGSRAGPSLIVAGTLLAGEKQPWRHVLVQSPEEAERVVLEQKRAGYEYIKAYDGLSGETYRRLVETAQRVHLPVVGHIPADVGLDGVLQSGQVGLDHLEKIVIEGYGHALERSKRPDLPGRIKAAGVTVTPTVAVHEILWRVSEGGTDQLRARPEMQLVPEGTRALWDRLASSLARRSPTNFQERFLKTQLALLGDLHRLGVPLVLGTDSGNVFQVPGYGVHDELRLMVTAGLSSYEALRAATSGAAAFLKRPDTGRIAVGARADLIVLEQNPLQRIEHSASVMGTMAGGRWATREALEAEMSHDAGSR